VRWIIFTGDVHTEVEETLTEMGGWGAVRGGGKKGRASFLGAKKSHDKRGEESTIKRKMAHGESRRVYQIKDTCGKGGGLLEEKWHFFSNGLD